MQQQPLPGHAIGHDHLDRPPDGEYGHPQLGPELQVGGGRSQGIQVEPAPGSGWPTLVARALE